MQIQVGSGGRFTVVTSNDIVDFSIATNDLSDNVITQEKLASNTVGSCEIISTQVQRRVMASCIDYFYLNGIGSPQCKQLPYGFDSLTGSLGGDYSLTGGFCVTSIPNHDDKIFKYGFEKFH